MGHSGRQQGDKSLSCIMPVPVLDAVLDEWMYLSDVLAVEPSTNIVARRTCLLSTMETRYEGS